MSLFNSILHGLQKKIDDHNAYKQPIIESIQSITTITLSPDAIISLKEGVLVIHTHPTVKMEILLKQKRILEKLKEHGLVVSLIK